MKYSKRILSLLGLAVIAGTLTSCDVNRNTQTPTGTLNLDNTYAKLANNNSISVSVGQMYNQFRSNGYSNVLTKIKETLFKNEIKNISYDAYKDEIDEYLLNQIFSVSTVEDYNDLDEDEKDICIQKFIDNQLSTYGIDLTYLKSNLKPIYDKDKDCLEYYWGGNDEVFESYKYTLAIIDYAKAHLENIREYKTLYDVDGEEVENDYYLPKDYNEDDEDADEQRESTYSKIKDLTATKYLLDGLNPYENEEDYKTKNQAIVVKFASKKQADKYIQKTEEKLNYKLSDKGLTTEKVKNFYVTLFDLYYKTKNIGDVESIETSKYTSFISDYDNNEMLDELGSTAIDFMKENLVDEKSQNENDSCYLKEPFNIAGDNIYYMCYRVSIYEGAEWDDLTKDQKETICNSYIDDKIIENWATESYANTLVEDLIKGTTYTTTENGARGSFAIEIYDPIYENQFYNSYEDYYDFYSKKNFNNKYVFKLSYTQYDENDIKNSIIGGYLVDDCYDDLNNIYGADKASSILTSMYLADTFLVDKVDEDTIDGYEDGLKSVIKSFKKNNTSYSKKMGLSNYLVLQYGFDDQDDILYYNLMASDLISAYSSYYGSFWTKGVYADSKDSDGKYLNSSMTDDISKALSYQRGENLLVLDEDNELLKIFYDYAKRKYEEYYSLDISHMLISVDYDHDGNNDDPEEFYESLSDSNQNLFRKDILTLADAIVKESAIINTTTKVEALQFIASTFNNPGYNYVLKCEEYKGKTWEDFKQNFEFSLRAEDLSTIDYSNGSNYVEEFTNAVIDLYDKINTDDYEDVSEHISDYGYWNYESYTYKEDDSEVEKVCEATKDNKVDLNASDLEQLTATTYGWHMLYVYDMTSQTTCQFTRSNDSNLSSYVYNNDDEKMVKLVNKNDDKEVLYITEDEYDKATNKYSEYDKKCDMVEKEIDGVKHKVWYKTETVTGSDGKTTTITTDEEVFKVTLEQYEKDTYANYTKSNLSSIKTYEYKEILIYENDDETTDDDISIYVSGYSEEDYASIAQIFIYFIETVNDGSVSSLRSTTSTAVKNVLSDVISRYTNTSFTTYRLYQQIGEIEFVESGSVNNNRYELVIENLKRSIDSYETLEEDDIFYGWFDNDWTIDLTEDYTDYTKLND